MLTNQEAFDKMVAHLLAQGRPAVDFSGSCMYRTSSGLKCAVGALIPDALYNTSFEEFLKPDTEHGIYFT